MTFGSARDRISAHSYCFQPDTSGSEGECRRAGCRLIANAYVNPSTGNSVKTRECDCCANRTSFATVVLTKYDENEADTVDLVSWCRKKFPRGQGTSWFAAYHDYDALSPSTRVRGGHHRVPRPPPTPTTSPQMLSRRDHLVFDCPDEATFLAHARRRTTQATRSLTRRSTQAARVGARHSFMCYVGILHAVDHARLSALAALIGQRRRNCRSGARDLVHEARTNLQ